MRLSFDDDFYIQNTSGYSISQSYKSYDVSKLCGSSSFFVKKVEACHVLFSARTTTDADQQQAHLNLQGSERSASSSILSNNKIQKIIEMFDEEGVTLERCYQATKDVFSARKLHDKIDGTMSFLVMVLLPKRSESLFAPI